MWNLFIPSEILLKGIIHTGHKLHKLPSKLLVKNVEETVSLFLNVMCIVLELNDKLIYRQF